MSRRNKRAGRKVLNQRKPVLRGKASQNVESAFRFVIKVKQAKNLKRRTLDDYEVHTRYFLDWLADHYGEGLSIERIDIDVLRDYAYWCLYEKEYYAGHPFQERFKTERSGLSPVTVNIRIRILKAIFNTLHKEGVIDENPAKNLEIMKTEQDMIQPLDKDEIRRLLAVPDQQYFAPFRNYIAIVLMLDTGIRIGELCSLNAQDIDVRARRIILPASHNKNRKSRVLPLSVKTAALLEQLTEEVQDSFETDYVFITNYGEPLDIKTLHKALSEYAKAAEIEKPVTPHILRHCFAKYASLNGMDVFTLQRILGHADISTTRKYVQMTDDDAMSQHDKYSPIDYLK
ncbi:tyrosine-type recombinase/integrase [Salibacterium sp. K-3]